MLKVITVVGTRPEFIKMSQVITALDRHMDHVLVHTGQNFDFELNEVFFNDLGIRKPDHFLEASGQTAIETIAQVLLAIDPILEREAPDAMMVYGDTNSCLAVIAAKRRKVPVFHMEAGNRCFDQRVPEELNRKVIDHLSDINLVLSEHARRYLISEGVRPDSIILTGSHMSEVLAHSMPAIRDSDILTRLKLEKSGYFLVSLHREENVDSAATLASILDSLNALVTQHDKPVIVSTHPRTRKRLNALPNQKIDPRISFSKPFGFHDYINLQLNAACVISDSGTITEEAALLGFPAITIRNTHERPEGMDRGVVIMSGLEQEQILNATKIVIQQHEKNVEQREPVADYGSIEKPIFVADQIVRLVQSYTGYINRTVWRKN